MNEMLEHVIEKIESGECEPIDITDFEFEPIESEQFIECRFTTKRYVSITEDEHSDLLPFFKACGSNGVKVDTSSITNLYDHESAKTISIKVDGRMFTNCTGTFEMRIYDDSIVYVFKFKGKMR